MTEVTPMDGTLVETTVRSASKGDEAAFARLVALHHPSMVRVAWVIADDPDIALDAVQSAWAIARRDLARLRDPTRVGSWLVVGGYGDGGALASVELFDPGSGTFTEAGRLLTERSGADAVVLDDGRVLVAGGTNDFGDPRTIEAFDPVSGVSEVVGRILPGQGAGVNSVSATRLRDGSVLIAGGDGGMAWRLFPLLSASAPSTPPPPPVGFDAVDGAGALRTGHSATRLLDGRVLIAGGPDASAELFDPSTGRSEPTGSMAAPRSGHAAALLADGRVLVVGGASEGGAPSAEPYDPATATFQPAGSSTLTPEVGRVGLHGEPLGAGDPVAVTLQDGRVVIVGWDPDRATAAPDSVRIYDPETGPFATATGLLAEGAGPVRSATLLPDGRVLVLTETHTDATVRAFVYDPAADSWADAGHAAAGQGFSTTQLKDGRVMVAGGDAYHAGIDTTDSAWIWDPGTSTFTGTGPMRSSRAAHAATLLPDDRVLVTGGFSYARGPEGNTRMAPVPPEVWDPRTGTFGPAGTMVAGRSSHTATLLEDGRVLIVGGVNRPPDRTDEVPPFAELYVGP